MDRLMATLMPEGSRSQWQGIKLDLDQLEMGFFYSIQYSPLPLQGLYYVMSQ